MMSTPVVNLDRLEDDQDSVGDARLHGEYFSGIAFEDDPTTGVVIAVIGYRFGKRHGAVREWDLNGRPVDESYRERSAPHGPARKWHRNGRLAEIQYSEHFILMWNKRWDEHSNLIEDYRLPETNPAWAKLQAARRQGPRPVIDIDLATLTFFERPEGWGRNESDLPPPQPPPSLELCRALESQSLAKR